MLTRKAFLILKCTQTKSRAEASGYNNDKHNNPSKLTLSYWSPYFPNFSGKFLHRNFKIFTSNLKRTP
uniref:Uncharacterized protein n=1 Tax=Pararge aegeria TaxID=116150 RepID=S4P7X5_9NEOP